MTPLPDPSSLTPTVSLAPIKTRLLERVADADTPRHVTHSADEPPWMPFLGQGSGVQIRVLHEADGKMSYLLHMQPGARLPAHRHREDEVCYLVHGTLRVGQALWIPAGGFHFARRGDLHASIEAETDAMLFLHGAVPCADDLLR